MDSGCYVIVTHKNMLGKVENLKSGCSVLHKKEKIAANAVNQIFMGRLA